MFFVVSVECAFQMIQICAYMFLYYAYCHCVLYCGLSQIMSKSTLQHILLQHTSRELTKLLGNWFMSCYGYIDTLINHYSLTESG